MDNHIQGVGPSLISEHTLEAFGFKFKGCGLNKYMVTPDAMVHLICQWHMWEKGQSRTPQSRASGSATFAPKNTEFVSGAWSAPGPGSGPAP